MLSSCASRFFKLTIVNRAGAQIPISFNEGDRLFDVIENTPAQELQGGCGGNMACGGCHCIVEKKVYVKPEDDETDIIDNVSGKTDTSRLACNLNLTANYDGTVIKMGPQ